MSLVFVGNAIGFITAAFFTNTILSKLGRAKTLVAAESIQLSAYTIIVCTPPYPLVIISYASQTQKVLSLLTSTKILSAGIRRSHQPRIEQRLLCAYSPSQCDPRTGAWLLRRRRHLCTHRWYSIGLTGRAVVAFLFHQRGLADMLYHFRSMGILEL